MGKVKLIDWHLHNEINIKGNWENEDAQVNSGMERSDSRCFTRSDLHFNKYRKQDFFDRIERFLSDFEKTVR